ncbi:hypothetical protein TNCV_4675531 [Trichonephila clavipes]|nr:hypothetical protein TNCV_4675531 [Trichonephila clavipes]
MFAVTQLDNATPYHAAAVPEPLENQDIRRFEWVLRSPDINPIENMWTLQIMSWQYLPSHQQVIGSTT